MKMFYCYHHQQTIWMFFIRSQGLERDIVSLSPLNLSADDGGGLTAGEWMGTDKQKYVCLTWCCGCSFSKSPEMNAGHQPSWEPVPLSENAGPITSSARLPFCQGLSSLSLCAPWLGLCSSPLLVAHLKWAKCLLCSPLFLLYTAGKSLHSDNHRICNCDDGVWAWIR